MPLLLKLKSILCSSKILHNITTKTGGCDMKIVFDESLYTGNELIDG